jgi:hypothetical protein
MKKITPPLLSVVLALAFVPVLAQESAPVANITNATWEQYRDMYKKSPLCSKDEITLWSCETGTHVYSLCSSRTMTHTSGYIQYRASNRGRTVFTYPIDRKPPLGSFAYSVSGNGDAYVEFTSNSYGYTLVDPLRYRSSILVSAPSPSRKQTEIECRRANTMLQINYTMRLMYDSGVWAGY